MGLAASPIASPKYDLKKPKTIKPPPDQGTPVLGCEGMRRGADLNMQCYSLAELYARKIMMSSSIAARCIQ